MLPFLFLLILDWTAKKSYIKITMFTLPTFLYDEIIAAGMDPAVWPPLGGFSNSDITFNSPLAERTIAEFEITSFTDTSVGEPKNTMATAVQTSLVSITSSTGMSLSIETLNSQLSTTLGKTSVGITSPSSSQLTTTSTPSTNLTALDLNTSSVTATSMTKSDLSVTSDQSNTLDVTSDKTVQLEVDSDKSTTIGSEDKRTQAST